MFILFWFKKVFVVYGRDHDTRHQLEAMLRRWDLEPLIFDQLPSEGQTIIEKPESYTSEVNFAVVSATPDDEGYKDAGLLLANQTQRKSFDYAL